MWKNYDLPSFVIIEGEKFNINTDWRNIIDIFECFNDEDLTLWEKFDCALDMFFENYEQIKNTEKAIEYMCLFINGNKKEEKPSKQGGVNADLKLIDWLKDLPLIIPPVNKVLGYDAREQEHLHWWKFLGALNEIDENCVFCSYIRIRHKIATHKKLEDWEKELYVNHKDEIDIKQDRPQYDNFDDEDILMKLAKQKNTFFVE